MLGRVSPGVPHPSSPCCGKRVWMRRAPFRVPWGCVGSRGWAAGQGAEQASPGSSLPGLAGAVEERGWGLFSCRGSAGSPSRGGEHPPRGTNFLRRGIFSETQSGWEARGRLASGGAVPCQEPLFPEPHTPEGRPVLRGDSGVTPGPPSSLGRSGRLWGCCSHPRPGCGALMLPTPGDAAGGPAGADPFCILE